MGRRFVCSGKNALHHYRLIKDYDRENCFNAFLHNNWFGAAVFAGLIGDYALR